MVVRIQASKIKIIIEKIAIMVLELKFTMTALQSLIIFLNFAYMAIIPGKPFCRRLTKATCGLTKPYHHFCILSDMKEDLNFE